MTDLFRFDSVSELRREGYVCDGDIIQDEVEP